LLGVFLAVSTALVGWNTYASWKEGPWDLPSPVKNNVGPDVVPEKELPTPKAVASIDAVVSRNLFDPERGAGAGREAEESSRAYQRIRNMILVGTVVIGNTRTAIIQDGAPLSANPAAARQAPTTLRLKPGDTVEGYRVAEIGEKRVSFAKDGSRVEIALDYFRKVDVPAPRTPAPAQANSPGTVSPTAPPTIPNLPRRSRIPVPGNPNPE
jgi:hypothetical protein